MYYKKILFHKFMYYYKVTTGRREDRHTVTHSNTGHLPIGACQPATDLSNVADFGGSLGLSAQGMTPSGTLEAGLRAKSLKSELWDMTILGGLACRNLDLATRRNLVPRIAESSQMRRTRECHSILLLLSLVEIIHGDKWRHPHLPMRCTDDRGWVAHRFLIRKRSFNKAVNQHYLSVRPIYPFLLLTAREGRPHWSSYVFLVTFLVGSRTSLGP